MASGFCSLNEDLTSVGTGLKYISFLKAVSVLLRLYTSPTLQDHPMAHL